MSKLKVIDGGADEAVTDITQLAKLEKEFNRIQYQLSDGGLYAYAYHYARLGSYRRAKQVLNLIDPNYFKAGIYKDLFFALMCWATYVSSDKKNDQLYLESEFYMVVRKSMPYFKSLDFKCKIHFLMFARSFKEMVDFTKVPD